MTMTEHTGTAIFWRRPYDPGVRFQQMMVPDEGLAVAAAIREGYLPKDASVVGTEPTFTRRNEMGVERYYSYTMDGEKSRASIGPDWMGLAARGVIK